MYSLFHVAVQVVAITVFCLLSVAFYAFFAPFLGKDIFEYIAIGVYSFLVSAIGIKLLAIFVVNTLFMFHFLVTSCHLLTLAFRLCVCSHSMLDAQQLILLILGFSLKLTSQRPINHTMT